MLTWYADEEVVIKFSQEPDIVVLYAKPNSNKREKDKIHKKPFLLKNKVDVVLLDLIACEEYKFEIPNNYNWDGATIPNFFSRIIGAKTDNKFLIASMVHDVLCENHDYINNDRYFSTIVFERLLYASGVGAFKRWLMKHSVDNFQKFCGWEN